MPTRGTPRPAQPLAARFLLARDGSTAVEFSIVAMPFLALLFAIFEIGLTFLATQNLDAALTDASRQIYTGTFQTSSSNKGADAKTVLANLRTVLCQVNGQQRATIFDCSQVKLNVIQPASFSTSAANATQVDATTGQQAWNSTFGTQYACGKGNDIIVVQAAVEYPVFLSQLYARNSLLANGKRVLQAAVAFRVEPLATGACS